MDAMARQAAIEHVSWKSPLKCSFSKFAKNFPKNCIIAQTKEIKIEIDIIQQIADALEKVCN